MTVYITIGADGNIFSVNSDEEEAKKDAKLCNGHVETWRVA
jgi:hypothetical protein